VSEVAGELERWIEGGGLWDAEAIDAVQARLATLGGATVDLVHLFDALRLRMEMGPVSPTMQRDVEAVVYPRLWKLVEAVRNDLSAAEPQIRIQVLNRRLAQLFVLEDPHASGRAGPPAG
jgi:hypothetical protein